MRVHSLLVLESLFDGLGSVCWDADDEWVCVEGVLELDLMRSMEERGVVAVDEGVGRDIFGALGRGVGVGDVGVARVCGVEGVGCIKGIWWCGSLECWDFASGSLGEVYIVFFWYSVCCTTLFTRVTLILAHSYAWTQSSDNGSGTGIVTPSSTHPCHALYLQVHLASYKAAARPTPLHVVVSVNTRIQF